MLSSDQQRVCTLPDKFGGVTYIHLLMVLYNLFQNAFIQIT